MCIEIPQFIYHFPSALTTRIPSSYWIWADFFRVTKGGVQRLAYNHIQILDTEEGWFL